MWSLNNKTILVTGGAGAIGVNLVNEIKKRYTCEVIVIDNLSSGTKKFLDDSEVELFEDTVTNVATLDVVFSKKIDVVFHLAAHFANQNSVDNPILDLETNILGTLMLLQHSAKYGVERFIYTNTSCMYGEGSDFIEKSNDFEYHTPYSISKHTAEKYVMWFYDYYGLKTSSIRIFNSYGPYELPGQYRNVIPNFINLALNKKPLSVMGDGTDTRSFTYVGDIVDGLIKSAETDKAIGEVINLGGNYEICIKDLADKINYFCENDSQHNFIERRDWDKSKRRKANTNKAKELLDFEPNISIDIGLKSTIEWFKSNITS